MTGIALLSLLLLLLGSGVLIVSVVLEERWQRAIAGKVDRIARVRRLAAAKAAKAEPAWPWLSDRLADLRRLFSFGMPRNWGTTAGTGLLLIVGLAAAGVVWLLCSPMLHLPAWLVILPTAASLVLAPRMVLGRQQRKAETRFMELFPDVVDMVVRMLRAGLPVSAAVRTVALQAPEPVNAVFAEIADQTEIGVTFEEALATTSTRIGVPDFQFFAVAVILQRNTGGNLTYTLEMLSEIIRKRRAVRLKAKAATSEVRISVYVLTALPFLVTGVIAILTPRYLDPLITDPRGNILVGVAVTSLLVGNLHMRWLIARSLKT